MKICFSGRDTPESTCPVEQYHLRQGKHALVLKSNTGEIVSLVVPGLVIPIRTIFDKQQTNQFIQSL